MTTASSARRAATTQCLPLACPLVTHSLDGCQTLTPSMAYRRLGFLGRHKAFSLSFPRESGSRCDLHPMKFIGSSRIAIESHYNRRKEFFYPEQKRKIIGGRYADWISPSNASIMKGHLSAAFATIGGRVEAEMQLASLHF